MEMEMEMVSRSKIFSGVYEWNGWAGWRPAITRRYPSMAREKCKLPQLQVRVGRGRLS